MNIRAALDSIADPAQVERLSAVMTVFERYLRTERWSDPREAMRMALSVTGTSLVPTRHLTITVPETKRSPTEQRVYQVAEKIYGPVGRSYMPFDRQDKQTQAFYLSAAERAIDEFEFVERTGQMELDLSAA